MKKKKGSYCLLINVGKHLSIRIGALGNIHFDKGLYVYVGSALNGLDARINRHMRTSKGLTKKRRWHIDYLLSNKNVRIEEIFYKETARKEECRVAKTMARHGIPVNKFGCSDCRCKSHLLRLVK